MRQHSRKKGCTSNTLPVSAHNYAVHYQRSHRNILCSLFYTLGCYLRLCYRNRISWQQSTNYKLVRFIPLFWWTDAERSIVNMKAATGLAVAALLAAHAVSNATKWLYWQCRLTVERLQILPAATKYLSHPPSRYDLRVYTPKTFADIYKVL
jgi:hypothetical protein